MKSSNLVGLLTIAALILFYGLGEGCKAEDCSGLAGSIADSYGLLIAIALVVGGSSYLFLASRKQ